MRIGINGRFLVAKRTGVQRAAYNLIKTIVQLDDANEYIIFSNEEEAQSDEWKLPNTRVVSSKLREADNIRNHLWEQLQLPRLAREAKIDILHSPANIAPVFYDGPSIINIHDLCFIVNPQWYSFNFRTFYNLIMPKLARDATKIITNSNNSRNDLFKYFGIPASKVSLIYWAVDNFFLKPNPDKTLPVESHEDYILYVGSLEPRKNISTLVSAYELLRKNNPQIKSKLVLIGGENPLFADVRLKAKEYMSDIIFKGFVSDDDLRRHYQNAKVVAYPSLYEGFGLPPLEAMAVGTPVVTSNVSSLPEVVGDAAITVDPANTGELAEALANVILDESLSSKLRARGLEQVKKFHWEKVARQTIAIYHEAYEEESSTISEKERFNFERWKQLKQHEVQIS